MPARTSMRTVRRIDCVRSVLIDGRKHIAELGGIAVDGSRWALAGHEVLARIQAGEEAFYIVQGGQSLLISVGVDDNGQQCLHPQHGNLFDLPEMD